MEIFNKLFGKQNKTTLKKTYYDNGNVQEEFEVNKKGERHGINKLYQSCFGFFYSLFKLFII